MQGRIEIKMRNDSIAEFTKANRMDLVDQNKREIEIFNLEEEFIVKVPIVK